MSTILRIETWMPVTDEQLIDLGLGTPTMLARDAARRAELQQWMRSPRGRWTMFRAVQLRGARRRIGHAWAALRGIEC